MYIGITKKLVVTYTESWNDWLLHALQFDVNQVVGLVLLFVLEEGQLIYSGAQWFSSVVLVQLFSSLLVGSVHRPFLILQSFRRMSNVVLYTKKTMWTYDFCFLIFYQCYYIFEDKTSSKCIGGSANLRFCKNINFMIFFKFKRERK